MIWNREAETLPREEMEALRLERRGVAVGRGLAGVPPLAARLRAAGIGAPEDLRSLADLHHLPFTYKTDLREHYPCGLFAVPTDRLVRCHASSGTHGKPTIVGYTRNDPALWAEVMAYVRARAAQGADCRCLNPGTDTCTATRRRCSGVMARSGASNLLVTTCSTRGGSKFSGRTGFRPESSQDRL